MQEECGRCGMQTLVMYPRRFCRQVFGGGGGVENNVFGSHHWPLRGGGIFTGN